MGKKILVVDDSALMRRAIREMLEKHGYEVITAKNGVEAVELNLKEKPDAITLDINMPVMDGITALSRIMQERPVPVIMVSSLTTEGALVTLEALNLGAFDYVTKPGGTISLNIDEIEKELIEKLRLALSGVKLRRRTALHRATPTKVKPEPLKREGLVIIGSSTGGPPVIEDILSQLPGDFPFPIVIAQHMPPTFTKSFAERLDKICALKVVEVNTPMELKAQCAYIGKGGTDVVIGRRRGTLFVLPKPEDPKYLWHPSVEALGKSALEHVDPSNIIAIMLTGMGYDGVESFSEIKKKGGFTIAEAEETCAVFGMPRALIERNGASMVLPNYKIAKQLIRIVKEG